MEDKWIKSLWTLTNNRPIHNNDWDINFGAWDCMKGHLSQFILVEVRPKTIKIFYLLSILTSYLGIHPWTGLVPHLEDNR